MCAESKSVEMECEAVSAAARNAVGLHSPPVGVLGYFAHAGTHVPAYDSTVGLCSGPYGGPGGGDGFL